MKLRNLSLIGIVMLMLMGTARGADVFSGYEGGPGNPETPGYYKMVYHGALAGSPRDMAFVLYVPQGYAQATKPWPMILYLHGLGERGFNPQMLFSSGIPRDMADRPELQQWAPFLILIPQCPADVRWETPGTGKMVAELTAAVTEQWSVDPQSVYLTGFSMGGSGCWAVAKEAGKQFAAIVPIVANAVEPQAVAAALRGSGAECLVISGAIDPKSEPGSTVMVDALRGAGVDVEHAKVPYGGHDLWPQYYQAKAFYEWLLLHHLGQELPAGRLKADAFIAMGVPRAEKNQQRYKDLNEQLQQVAKWWQVDNCSLQRTPGLRDKLLNRATVYVTQPYTVDVPCRLQTTTKLPTGKHVALNLVVGHHPQGSWKLVVRVNERERLTTIVEKSKSDRGWMTLRVDLTELAGQEVRLQLINANNGAVRDDAYWGMVKIVSD